MVSAFTKLGVTVLPSSYVGEHMQGLEGVYTGMLQSQERLQGRGVLERLVEVTYNLALQVPWGPQQLQPGSGAQSFVNLRLCLILLTIATNVPSLRTHVFEGLDVYLRHVVEAGKWHLQFQEWGSLCRVISPLVKDPSAASELLVGALQDIGEACADPFLVLTNGKAASSSRWEACLRSVQVVTQETAHQGPEVFTLAALDRDRPQVRRQLLTVAEAGQALEGPRVLEIVALTVTISAPQP